MSRPRRTSIELLCDVFADMTPDQQDGILLTLQALHRQAKRRRAPEITDTDERDLPLPLEAESEMERIRR